MFFEEPIRGNYYNSYGNFCVLALIIIVTCLYRQCFRSNIPSSTPLEYYKRSIMIPFLDHIQNELGQRFSSQQKKGIQLLNLLPSNVTSNMEVPKSLKELVQLYHEDLPSPQVFINIFVFCFAIIKCKHCPLF